jgi:tetratricopeptide (TPR) repeat protein/transcriptional regulator with XRE-family HTH domain
VVDPDDEAASGQPYSAARMAADLDLLRRASGLSYRQLGKRTGCPASTLNDALGGRRFPRLDTVLAIARACGHDETRWRERWMKADVHRRGLPGSAVVSAAAPSPAELPHDVPGFAGRAAELDRLRSLYADSATAQAPTICVVHGMAGVGKTALALRWAHRIAGEFADGQLFLELRGHHPGGRPVSAGEALEQLLRSLGAPSERIPPDASDSARLYRSLLAGKRVLVVLDDADSADQVRPLLPASAGCLVIVTSRHRLTGLLARDGAYHVPLDVLDLDESRALLAGTLGRERIERDAAGADELARACGHLPLALRIAAAHLVAGPYGQISELVARLTGGNPLAGLRAEDDSGVRRAFDLSYDTLDDDARRLFRRLGIVPGADVTADAAARIMNAADASRLLDTLFAAHLLDQRTTGRYQMHDLLRLYAAERAAEEETAAAREGVLARLLDWQLHMVDAAAHRLYPDSLRLPRLGNGRAPAGAFAADGDALGWLEVELANLAASVNHAAEYGPYPVAWQLADGLRGLFNLRLHRREWFDVASAGLTAARRGADERAQAAMHHSLGLAHSRLGSNRVAVEQFASALRLYRRLDEPEGTAAVLTCLGGVHRQLGQTARAAEAFQQALDLSRQQHLTGREAACLGDLGEVYRDQGNLVEALRCQHEALELFQRIEVPRGEALALLALGAAHHQLGRSREALSCQTRALKIFRSIGSRDGEAYAMTSLADVHREVGHPELALRNATAALSLAVDLGDDALVVEAHLALAAVVQDQAGPRAGVRHHQAALRLARTAGYRHGEAKALAGLARTEVDLGQLDKALARCARAMASSSESGYQLVQADLLATSAAAHHRAGRDDQALADCRQALDRYRRTGHRPGEEAARALLALIQDKLTVPSR